MMNGGKMGRRDSGVMRPAGKSYRTTPAGDQFKPGDAVDGSTLGGAVDELYHQHPINWNNLGPHHETRQNEIHEPHPYEGLSPKASGAGKDPSISKRHAGPK